MSPFQDDKALPDDPLAALISAIGTAAFADRFLDAMRSTIVVDMCSAFVADGDGKLRLLLTAGEHPRIPGFAVQASLDYADTYWRSDVAGRRLRGRAARTKPLLVRQWASDIADPAYRHACYERGGIGERITIHAAHGRILFASGYRMAERGPTPPVEIERLEALAPSLLAAAETHERVRRQQTDGAPDDAETIQQLMRCGLSGREATVCAGLIAGRTQMEIADSLSLSAATIVTYRRRAYAKLGVANRRALAQHSSRYIVNSMT